MLLHNLALKIIKQERQDKPNDNASKIKRKIKLIKQHHQKDLDIIRSNLTESQQQFNSPNSKEHQVGLPPCQ